jgi:hypothetical protein
MMANDSQEASASVGNLLSRAAEHQNIKSQENQGQQHEEFIKPDITSKELRLALDNTPARPQRFELIRLQRRKERLASHAQVAAKSPVREEPSITTSNVILGAQSKDGIAGPSIDHPIEQCKCHLYSGGLSLHHYALSHLRT